MATYTPIVFIGPVQDLSTTTYYSLPASTTAIIRTVHALANAAGKTFTMTLNGADAVGKRIIEAYALTANVPAQFNVWQVNGTASASAIGMFSNTGTSDIVRGNISGYTYV